MQLETELWWKAHKEQDARREKREKREADPQFKH